MLRSVTVKGFRCFRELKVEPLERVNLIAGRNNVGKTSLLEALFLLVGATNPGLPHALSLYRGINRVSASPSEMWGWLFADNDTGNPIEISATDEENRTAKLRLALEVPVGPSPSPDEGLGSAAGDELSTEVDQRELVLDYTDFNEGHYRSGAHLGSKGKLLFENVPDLRLPLGIFLAATTRSPRGNLDRFDKLDRTGRQDEVLGVLRNLEPRLKRLALTRHRGATVVGADIDGLRERIPVHYMGEGFVRLLCILLAISDAQGGTVLIDETENGLHHSVLVDVWGAIGELAEKENVQVFATTHSWECVCAAHRAFCLDGTYDFRLHRLEREGEDVVCVSLDRETLETAVSAELEVR